MLPELMGGGVMPEEGFKINVLDDAIARKKKNIPFTTKDNMEVYDCVFKLCNNRSHDYSDLIHQKYVTCLTEFINEKAPPFVEKTGTALLADVTQFWQDYMEFTNSLSKLFVYLERRLEGRNMPTLVDVSKQIFCNLLLDHLYSKLKEMTITMIREEREGKQTYRDALNNVLQFLWEAGENGPINYYETIEQVILDEVAAYCSQPSLEQWIWGDALENYLQKVDWCLAQELSWAQVYPSQSTRTKVLEVVKCILLERNAKKWAQMPKRGELSAEYQELLSKCTRLSLEEGSSDAAAPVSQK